MPELIDRPRVQIKRVTVVKCPLILRVFKLTFELATLPLIFHLLCSLFIIYDNQREIHEDSSSHTHVE